MAKPDDWAGDLRRAGYRQENGGAVLMNREHAQRVVEHLEKQMADESEMKPCPFCGGDAQISKHFKEDIWQLIHRCPVVGAIVIDWMEPKQRVVDRWNTRAALEALRKP